MGNLWDWGTFHIFLIIIAMSMAIGAFLQAFYSHVLLPRLTKSMSLLLMLPITIITIPIVTIIGLYAIVLIGLGAG